MKKIFTFAIMGLVLLGLGGKEAAAAPPQISFVEPTPADGATIEDTSVEIQASIIESALADVAFNWDGTDCSLYDDSLVLMFNFDNVAALGEDYVNGSEVIDVSGSGNNGLLSVTPGIPEWIPDGKYGGAFDFTGNGIDSGQSILVYHSDSLNPGSGDFAIAVWILTKDDYDGDVLRKGSTGTASTWYKVEHAPGGDAGTLSLNFNTDGTDATITSTQVYNDNQWHFVVAQRNGSQAQLWIDGVLDGSTSISGSISNTANLVVGSKDTQDDDFINSALDEVRIYKRSFSEDAIKELYYSNLSKYDIDKWTLYVNQSNLTDGATYTYQASATNSAIPAETSSTEQRTLTVNLAGVASSPSPADAATGVSPVGLNLSATVYDPDGSEDVDVAFYGREAAFTIVVLPDTQGYSQSYPEIFDSQTQWIVDSADALNTVFVTHVGDIVENYDDVEQEWINANNSMSILDGKVPYGLLPGNHDKPTGYYNQYFSYTRYEGLAWYGGHYPETGNDNNYQLFSAGGEDYIILHIEFCPGSNVLDWGNWILQQYPERKAIIVTHGFINEFGERTVSYCDTQYIWDALVLPNDNVWFVLCGHNGSVGEALRTDFVTDHDVYQLLSCYQRRSNGGNGWLRIMQFVPAEDTVYVYTYSPWLDQYETDGNSEFTLNFPMSGSDFSAIGTNTGVPSGSNASVEWSGLATGTQYEWYVTVTESSGTTAGPVWNFTTGGNQAPVAVDDDIYSVDEDTLTPLDVEAPGVLGNDTDPENDPLTAILVDDVTNGTLTLNSDGSFTYTPNANFSGTDIFTYVADDGISSSNIATVTITVNNVDDDPPVAVDDTPTADEDVPLNIDVLGNDSDPDGDTLSILSVTVPDQGGAVVNNGTDVTYTPASDFYGVETFSYTVTDGTAGDERSATVTVTVNSINDDPVANDDTAATDEDTAVTINVLENDTDVDTGDTLTVTSVTQPGNGAVINNGTDVTYTPNADFFGSDSFTYTVGDGNGGSATGTVNVTVNSINDPPAAPQNLYATAGPSVVNLDWDDNVEQEGDLAGYNIYRSQTSGSYDFGSPLANVTVSAYTDNTVVNDTTYYYVVKAVDNVGLESTAASNEVSATPADTAYDAYVIQDPIVTFGTVTGGINGTTTAGDALVQTITEVPNGRAGMASLEAEYLLHTTASPAEVTGLTLYLDATWTALDGTADPLLTNIMVWNGASGWEDITGDIGDGSFVAPDPQKCIDGDGNIRLLFTDTTAVKKEKKDTLTIDLLYAHISAGPVDNPPVVTITSPSDGATFGSGVVISFVGTGIDAEDGDLTSGLVWQSDIDGQIGTGGSFTTTLNDGEHAITTSVTDSGSNIGSASISITVGDPPPAPPTGLAASAGDGQVSLDWDDNAEPDVVGYNVYRSETSGGPYSQVNGTLLATSDYLDLGVINETTYYYVVTAVDSATPIPNEGGNSSEASATPSSQQTVYVESIDMSLELAGKNTKGIATILISEPQAGATVFGDWYLADKLIATGSTVITDGAGYAVNTSPPKKAKSGETFRFEITDVVLSGYIYDQGQGVTSGSITIP